MSRENANWNILRLVQKAKNGSKKIKREKNLDHIRSETIYTAKIIIEVEKLYKYVAICYMVMLTLSFTKGYCTIHPLPLRVQLIAPFVEILAFILIMTRKQMMIGMTKVSAKTKQLLQFLWKKQVYRDILLTLVVCSITIILLKIFIQEISNLIDANEISNEIIDDFVDVVSSVAIGTIIGILTIALPIIISSMHTLADRYQTNYVLALLNRDDALVAFRILLLISLSLSATWVGCYFGAPDKLCLIAVILFICTLVFIVSLIVLVARMVYYSMPDKLFKIVISKLDDYPAPKYYFNGNVLNDFHSWGSKEEEKRLQLLKENDKYDSKITRLFVIIARIFAIFGSDIVLRKDILQYWEQVCRKASYIDNDRYKRYTAGYYNFIYELADWAIDHNDAKLEEETITLLNILLKAHIGESRRLGEPLTEEHTKKYLVSFETFECLWKTMRKSVDCSNDDMFKKYWQIVNNFYSLKYRDIQHFSINDEIKQGEEVERSVYLIIHYLCCSYLMGRKKYNLVEYVLHYSQQSRFEWYLIPHNASDIITAYCYVKDWYANWEYKEHFSFTEDYNLFSDIIISNPIAQLTSLLLLLFGEETSQLKDLNIEIKYQPYIYQLLDTLSNIDEETDWIRVLRLEDAMKYKEGVLKAVENLLNQPRSAAPGVRFSKKRTLETEDKKNCFRRLLSCAKTAWSYIKSLID